MCCCAHFLFFNSSVCGYDKVEGRKVYMIYMTGSWVCTIEHFQTPFLLPILLCTLSCWPGSGLRNAKPATASWIQFLFLVCGDRGKLLHANKNLFHAFWVCSVLCQMLLSWCWPFRNPVWELLFSYCCQAEAQRELLAWQRRDSNWGKSWFLLLSLSHCFGFSFSM